MLTACIPQIPVSAETSTETTAVYTLYENTFNDGAASVAAVDNEYLEYSGVKGTNVSDALYNNEERSIRIRKGAWVNGQTFNFDFTKGGTQTGIRSGKVTISFDFEWDFTATANEVRLGMNMKEDSTWEGGYMFAFKNQTASSSDVGAAPTFGYMISDTIGKVPSEFVSFAEEGLHSFKTVLDFENEKVTYYLDDELLSKEQTDLGRKTLNNYCICLSGMFNFFDNLKITQEYLYPIEYIVTSEKTGNNFFGNEQIKLTVTATNRGDVAYTENPVVKYTNPQGENEVVLSQQPLEIPARSSVSFDVTPNLKEYGSWQLSVESERSRVATSRFARIVEVDELNDTLGICAHFDGRHSLDIEKAFDLMEAAGLSMVRSDHGYAIETDDAGNITGFSETKGKP